MTGSGKGPGRPDMSTSRLLRGAVAGVALLLVFAMSAVLLTLTTAAASGAPFAVAPSVIGGGMPGAGSPASSPVRAVAASAVDRAVLIRAFLSARRLPAGTVGGIRPGSLHLASLPTIGIEWAMASFTPSPPLAKGPGGIAGRREHRRVYPCRWTGLAPAGDRRLRRGAAQRRRCCLGLCRCP